MSAYEDKALGHGADGGIFNSLKNKTFSQFIDHVLKDIKTPQSEHWRPQFLNCNYCGINYDMIGRVETLNKDLEYISDINDIQFITSKGDKFEVNPSGGEKSNKKEAISQNDKKKRKTSTEIKTMEYFATLSSTQLNNLYTLFQMDFEIFGYSVYPFVLDPNYNKI